MENREKVHIGLPVFNGESHLKEALESLLNQTYKNFDIFIVNNASTDSTQEIIQYYAKLDSRIKSYQDSHWVCATENWNRTYELASRGAELFMWASDDDIVARDYIEQILPPLLENPGLVLSFSQGNLINEKGNIIGHFYDDTFPRGPTAFSRIRSILKSGKYTAINGLIRAQAINWAPCLYDTCFGSDLWFLIRLAMAGEFCMIRKPLFFKRTGGISTKGTDPSACLDTLKIWNIGEREWALLRDLNIDFSAKIYIYYRLKIFAKTLFPEEKKIDWFLLPVFWIHILRLNPRSLGIRTRMRRYIYNLLKRNQA
jgi:glycosyltransferase involved in cell wall biosynthesis